MNVENKCVLTVQIKGLTLPIKIHSCTDPISIDDFVIKVY